MLYVYSNSDWFDIDIRFVCRGLVSQQTDHKSSIDTDVNT